MKYFGRNNKDHFFICVWRSFLFCFSELKNFLCCQLDWNFHIYGALVLNAFIVDFFKIFFKMVKLLLIKVTLMEILQYFKEFELCPLSYKTKLLILDYTSLNEKFFICFVSSSVNLYWIWLLSLEFWC